MQVKDLKQDRRNYRKHNERNLDLIKKSINEVGLGRSIVIDSENEIVCGNGLVSQLDKNTPVKVIETDGSELVVVKRTDLNTDDEKRKKLAVMDNSTSDSSEFDIDLMSEDFTNGELLDMGVVIPEDVEVEVEDSKYTRKVSIPVYEIKGEEPEISEMIDTNKADKFIKQIQEMDIPYELKKFLIDSATRLYEFNYSKIAEFYAHQNKDVQDIMEKLALVLIDVDKAIENGYVKMNSIIEDIFQSERNEENG
jgi:hypothetical protein